MSSLISEFYRRVLDDKELAYFFESVNLEKLIGHQTNFLIYLLGGPNEYSGSDIEEVHKKMKIDNHHFIILAGHLQDTLNSVCVDKNDIKEIMKIFSKTQVLVVNS